MFNKTDVKPKLIKRDKESYFLSITGTIQKEEITIINVGAPHFKKQT
jgi:hypothetical protein